MLDLCQASVIRRLMEEEGIALKKAYGQNFLINPAVPERIAQECSEKQDAMILEIGPGIGCLTSCLARRFRKVVAIEIDTGLIPVLDKTLAEFDNVKVINSDVMQVDLPALLREESDGGPVSVCANLPYYITTPILMRLLECGASFETITVMVQAEVASRLTAKPGEEAYGAITAVMGYYGVCRRLFAVSAGNFLPAPKVDSAVVQLQLYRMPRFCPKDEQLFFQVIRGAFEQRRKTLVNALSAKLGQFDKAQVACAIKACGFPELVRGERLSTEDFVRLSDALTDGIDATEKEK